MSVADSVIRVSITGDASKLQSELGKADRSLGGSFKNVAKAAGGLLLAGVAIDKAFDFAQGALNEADRMGDAVSRLNQRLGETDAQKVNDMATGFVELGQSKQDVLELAAAFADFATAKGVDSSVIADLSDEVVGVAAALALVKDIDADQAVDLISKAAGGAAKAAAALGVELDPAAVKTAALAAAGKTAGDALSDEELFVGRLNIILADLAPLLDEAKASTSDLEKSQLEMGARVETLQAQLGEKLAPALATVLEFILDEIDAIPGAIDGFILLGETIAGFGATVLTPLARVADVLRNILTLFGQVQTAGSQPFHPAGGGQSTAEARGISTQSVVNAVNQNASLNGLQNNQGQP